MNGAAGALVPVLGRGSSFGGTTGLGAWGVSTTAGGVKGLAGEATTGGAASTGFETGVLGTVSIGAAGLGLVWCSPVPLLFVTL